MANDALRTLSYGFSLEIDAPTEVLWASMVGDIGGWWLPDFHMLGESSKVHLQATAGGHLIETSPDGQTLLWYTVQMCTPNKSLHLVGYVAPAWGGPATTMLELRLEAKGQQSELHVSDALMGKISEGMAASLEDGWKKLFGDGLRTHVESQARA